MNSLAGSVSVPGAQTTNISPTVGGIQSNVSGLESIYGGLGASVLPYAQSTTSNLYNNPFDSTALSGAQGAAGYGAGAAGAQYSTGASLVPYATSILNTAFDPQQALYNQQYALNQQQGAVNNAQAGVATTPYGAGLQDQSGQNFNINWQNNLLGRMVTGAQGAEGLATTGTGLMAQAPTTLASTSQIPYSTYNTIGSNQYTDLSSLLGIGQSGANLSNMSTQDLISLLSGQNSANSVANQSAQTALNQSNLAFNQYGTLASAGLGLAGLFV